MIPRRNTAEGIGAEGASGARRRGWYPLVRDIRTMILVPDAEVRGVVADLRQLALR